MSNKEKGKHNDKNFQALNNKKREHRDGLLVKHDFRDAIFMVDEYENLISKL